MYQYIHEDDENTFQLVDSTRLPKPAYQKRTRFQQNVSEKSKERDWLIIIFHSDFVKIKLKMVDLEIWENKRQVHRKNPKP